MRYSRPLAPTKGVPAEGGRRRLVLAAAENMCCRGWTLARWREITEPASPQQSLAPCRTKARSASVSCASQHAAERAEGAGGLGALDAIVVVVAATVGVTMEADTSAVATLVAVAVDMEAVGAMAAVSTSQTATSAN